MFLTIETLKRLNACEQGTKYIERFYPNGAELIDIINDKHISKEFLHWGREHLTINDEELEAYRKACRIENTEGHWYSQDVRDSKYVIKSKDVENSIGVFESMDIKNSADIISSENVDCAHQIFSSSMVDTAQRIFKGQNISHSTNICNSTMIANSTSVIDSCNIFDSSEIIKGVSVSDSHFCQDIKNLKHCMFCYGFENAEYCIFNVPIEKNHYELIEKQYQKYLTEELAFIREWPREMISSHYIAPTRKFDDWYHPISEKFWKWARTLPFFDASILYNITMKPELLEG